MTPPTVAIIQARMGSSRLPGKVLKKIERCTVLEMVILAVREISGLDQVVVATSADPNDRAILVHAKQLKVDVFAGSQNDVLGRYYSAAKQFKAEVVMRVTSDCPLLDPGVSSTILDRFNRGKFDYVSNCHPASFPDGLDTEVFSFQALETAWGEAKLPSEREHVTPYLWNHPDRFQLGSVVQRVDRSGLRWTVDQPEDLEFVRAVCQKLQPQSPPYRMEQILEVLERFPEITQINAKYMRNESYVC